MGEAGYIRRVSTPTDARVSPGMEKLRALIRVPTISYRDEALIDHAAFERLQTVMAE